MASVRLIVEQGNDILTSQGEDLIHCGDGYCVEQTKQPSAECVGGYCNIIDTGNSGADLRVRGLAVEG